MQSLETHDFYCACNYLCLNNKKYFTGVWHKIVVHKLLNAKNLVFLLEQNKKRRKRNAHCALLCLIVDHGLGVFAVGCSFYGASNDSRS